MATALRRNEQQPLTNLGDVERVGSVALGVVFMMAGLRRHSLATGQGETALSRGFAVVTTDTGHRGEVFDASFMADQQASLDFAYQAVGRVVSASRTGAARSPAPIERP